MDKNITVSSNFTNWTTICTFVDYKPWYPISGGISLVVSLYMLVVSLAYYLGCLKAAKNDYNDSTDYRSSDCTNHGSIEPQVQRTTTRKPGVLKKFNQIIAIIWLFVAFALLPPIIRYFLGKTSTCLMLAISYGVQSVLTFLGFTAMYGCLWYRCYVIFARSFVPMQRIKLFRRLSTYLLVFYLLTSLPAAGLFIVGGSSPTLLRIQNGKKTSYDEFLFKLSMIMYGLATAISQLLLLLLFSFPIRTYQKQLKNCPRNAEKLTKVITLLKKLWIIAVVCVLSDAAATAMNFIPPKIMGTGRALLMNVDLTVNGLLLILSFKDPMVRFGLYWVSNIFFGKKNQLNTQRTVK